MQTNEDYSSLIADQVPSPYDLVQGFSTAGGNATGGLIPSCLGSIVDKNGEAMTLNGDTQFELGSVTKTFTALLYLYALEIEKVVAATDPLSKWIPDLSSAGLIGSLALQKLANYTSGLPADNSGNPGVHPENPKGLYTAAKMIAFLTAHAAKIDPLIVGQLQKTNVYAYSNLGFSLLGFAAANAINGNFDNDLSGAMRSVIFSSNGLNMPSSFLYDADEIALPRGYDSEGNPAGPGNPLFPGNWGGGGIVSTGNDMVRYLSFVMGVLSDCKLNSLLPFVYEQTWNTPRISAGWFLNTMTVSKKPNLTYYEKDGALPGFSSWIGFVPRPNATGQFILTNRAGWAPSIGRYCLKYWNGYLPPAPQTSQAPNTPSPSSTAKPPGAA